VTTPTGTAPPTGRLAARLARREQERRELHERYAKQLSGRKTV
jgi:hypothetical protein